MRRSWSRNPRKTENRFHSDGYNDSRIKINAIELKKIAFTAGQFCAIPRRAARKVK